MKVEKALNFWVEDMNRKRVPLFIIESRWGRIFPHLSRPALGSNQPPYNGYRVLRGGKERPGRDADPSPLLVPWSRKSRAIPLLHLWAVRPVQSLSACTKVTFTFTCTPLYYILLLLYLMLVMSYCA